MDSLWHFLGAHNVWTLLFLVWMRPCFIAALRQHIIKKILKTCFIVFFSFIINNGLIFNFFFPERLLSIVITGDWPFYFTGYYCIIILKILNKYKFKIIN